MDAEESADSPVIFSVVVNEEGQYSIWPQGKQLPLGWHDAGKLGSKSDCLAYVKEVWTDLRPISLRKHMDAWRADVVAQ